MRDCARIDAGTDGAAQDRRARARVAIEFGSTGLGRLGDGVPATRIELDLRQVARLGGATLVGVEEAFDDAIFERMETDDSENTALAQQALGGKEAFDELIELAIDRDAQGLERARGGMRVTRLAADGFFDDAGEFERCRYRGSFAGSNNELSDAARLALFAEGKEQVCQLFLFEIVDEIGGAFAGLAHAHVERPFAHEGETALAFIELHGADADIEHDAVNGRVGRGKRVEFRKRAGNELESTGKIGRQFVGMRLHIGIAVDGDDFSTSFEQGARIAACAKSAINDAPASKRRKCSHNLVQEDGDVRRIHHRGFGQVPLAHTDQNSTSGRSKTTMQTIPDNCMGTLKILFPIGRQRPRQRKNGPAKPGHFRELLRKRPTGLSSAGAVFRR